MQKEFSEKFLEWSEKIKDQKLSNKSIVQWCKEKGISYHTFQYWQQRMKQKIPDKPNNKKFVEIPETDPLIEISLRGVKITISKDYDRSSLMYLFNLLKIESC